MEKNILERLAEKTAKSGSLHAKRNFAVFLALRDQINLAINSGWSVKDIWELLHDEGKMVISYQVFLRLVKKHTDYKTHKRSTKKSELESEVEEKQNNRSDDTHKESLSENKKDLEPAQEKTDSPKSPKYPDTGNPKGFEWSADYNGDDII